MKNIQFKNGDQMPIFGLGTWKSETGKVYSAVKEALRAGYRHIDCAPIYGNEVEVGQALADSFKEGIVSREQVWITSKLWNNAHAPEDVQPALEKTLADLQIDYLNLFLIHWPVALKKEVVFPSSSSDLLSLTERPIAKTWPAMEQLVEKGLCKHIGVSNFSIAKLKTLIETAKQPPEMNQIELHPYLQQAAMLKYCAANNIHLTAYAPLGSADRPARLKTKNEPILLEDPVIIKIAKEHNATPAQILISWAIHRETVVIPKSITPERIKQNLEATKIVLSAANMTEIEKLERNNRYVSGNFWTMEGSPYSMASLWDE
ncbi:aldo/keto reductase [Desulforhopalus sp. IMCC35007]|uniref:aldo/keto reductase n=1 Tax=Desulforhopalus sp. IMCC35007 TaxID=2569543 RepID=UPI0010AE9A87|nr:aldo/keto reductase [Desulforhopalus sp. IMCC35007]TKB07253.1 aldo/keto reductase [Desulforhopalus sp. IMCC35007]